MSSSINSSSNFNSSDSPVFIVGPQPVLNTSELPKQGKQITFRTDQRQYRQGLQNGSTKQHQLRNTPRPTSYSRKIRFADPKTQIGFTSKQFNPDEPPAKRPKVTRYGKDYAEPTFSVRKPLKIHVPLDAWQLIFQRCDLAFLTRARLVCKGFRDVLERQSLWRKARVNYYGDEIPDPPKGITEFRYAALLVGRGCQIKPCTRKDTRKVYWPFMLRMCEKCFDQMTQVPSLSCEEARSYSRFYHLLEYEVRKTIPAQLPGLLPAGRLKSSRWIGPRPLDEEKRNWLHHHISDTTLVLTEDYEALRFDFNDKIARDPDYFLFWARLKWGETRDRMCKVAELEDIDLGEPFRPYDLREQKIILFREQASKLDPPMDSNVLQKFAAFHNAIETPNAASLRSWDTLRAKIDVPELRTQAELLVQWDQNSSEWGRGKTSESDVYSRVHEHRTSGRSEMPRRYTREQEVIIDIANEELDDLLDIVHDEDVLLMWFDRVRRGYESLQQKPDGLNGDGTEGPYNLMLDDALMIVQDILKPVIRDCKNDMGRYKKILTSLRCMGCSRTSTTITFDFQGLMAHIRKFHAGLVSKGSHWYRMAVPTRPDWRGRDETVAWYRLPWFKTMPALPFHRKATPGMIWNPDVETSYIEHGGARSPPTTFDVIVTSQTRIPIDDFTSNFVRAMRIFIDTRLASIFVIKVALEYATRVRNARRIAGGSPAKLTTAQLQSLETVCARDTTRLEFKFQCRKCAKVAAESPRKRRPPKPKTLPALASHWQLKHRTDQESCVTERIVLPSEFELMKTMEEEDTKLEAEKSSHLRKSAKSNESIDPRTAALLATPSIRSCFDRLFMPRATEDDRT